MPRQRKTQNEEQLDMKIGDEPVSSEVSEGRDDPETPRLQLGKPDRKSTRADRQEFFLPVTGFVWFYPEEVQIINHPAFQRLGRIYQLGQTYVVYRGATHKRIEHALGATHIAQRMIDAVNHTSAKARAQENPRGQEKVGWYRGAPLSEQEFRFVRLGALLHDIGHIVAGHTVEDELCLVGKHDEDPRLDSIFKNEDDEWKDLNDRTLERAIDEEFSRYLPTTLVGERVKASEVVRLLIRRHPKDKEKDAHLRVFGILEESNEIRLNICRDIIGNTICADILDYLHRDWYHLGKPRPFDERILQYMEVRTQSRPMMQQPPKPSASDRFVVSLGRRPKIRSDAVSAILELLEWRYQLAESVLFHRTKLSAAGMLDRALYELWGENTDDVEEFLLPLSDEQMIGECIKLAEEKSKNSIAAKLLRSLEKRELYADLRTFTFYDLPSDVNKKVQDVYGRTPDGDNVAPRRRARVLQQLEDDFALPAGSLVMYCPTAGMNAKIAQVNIAVGDEVDKFSSYEKEHSDMLSGGHLRAQLRRFGNLWRIHFCMDRKVKDWLSEDVVHLLRTAIEKLVLGHQESGEDILVATRMLAQNLVAAEDSPWKGKKVSSEPTVAAHKGEAGAIAAYAFGAPSIKSFIES